MLVRRLILTISLVLNSLLIYTLIWGQQGAIAYKDLREQCDLLENQIADIGKKNLELSKEIRLLQSDEKYIEKTIRNRLNFVRENEILYIFPGQLKDDYSGDIPNETKN